MALWRAREVDVLITSSSTATAASDFSAATDYAGYFESVEFKEPERNTGEVKLLGETGGNANSDTFEEDPTVSELSGDLVLTPNDDGTPVDLFDVFFGDADSVNYGADPNNPSIMIRFGDATNYVGFIMTGVKLNSMGGVSIEADGHAKSSGFKVTASADDTYKVKGGTYSTATP